MIEVRNLTIEYVTAAGRVCAVDGVTFTLSRSEMLGLVGESGSGKSTMAMALLGHVAALARVRSGEVVLDGEDLLTLPAPLLATYRGRRIGFVPQNPAMGLSPHLRIGRQFAELVLHHGIASSRAEALALAQEHFSMVGLPAPKEIAQRYPHELSGGQQQRVCIALAIACRPEMLVLDEPTTGLDVTTQMRIINLLKDLRSRLMIGMLYVTHDLGLLTQIADRVGVMYAGRLVEIASAEDLFAKPRHPYTRGLIASVPSLDNTATASRRLRGMLDRRNLPRGCAFAPRCEYAEPSCAANRQSLDAAGAGHAVACQRWRWIERNCSTVFHQNAADRVDDPPTKRPILVNIDKVSLAYRRPNVWHRLLGIANEPVVRELSLTIEEGQIFALVGESGSGKSTIARALSGLLAPLAGVIQFRGAPLAGRLGKRPLEVKRQVQYVFQNPDASLNPRERVLSGLARPLRLYFRTDRSQLEERLAHALEEVRLDPSYASRFPDQLSGGERQRVAIARGLAAEPSLILCDEVLSALDVSVQANILDLLARLRRETGVAMLFISHDLAVVRKLADRTGVLFQGTLVEVGLTESIFEPPYHPYTEELLLAVPSFRDGLRGAIRPSMPRSGGSGGRGCVYARRCRSYRGSICDEEVPPWRTSPSGHAIRCHIPLPELAAESLIAEPSARDPAEEQRPSIPEVTT
jgi:peptide/nickel transport system ATP-binding protein